MKERGLLVEADLHVHTRFSDGVGRPEQIVRQCEIKQIGCLAITDHNTIDGAEPVRQAAQEMGIDLVVITGEEITTGENNTSGKKIELLAYFLKRPILSGLSLEQTLKEIQKQEALPGVSHPFELWRHGAGKEGGLEIIKLARELQIPLLWEIHNSRSLRKNNQKSQEFFKNQNDYSSAGLLAIAGSDAHHPEEIGRAKLWLNPRQTPEEFLASLKSINHPVSGWVITSKYHGDDRYLKTLFYRIKTRARRVLSP